MGKRLARWWLVLLLLAISVQASERRYYFDGADSERGLASHSVNAIFQDRAGFIWIGTDSGLHQYDGYSYQRFEHASRDSASLPDSVIMAITQDAHNRLWVGTNTHGIAAIDTATSTVVSTSLIGVAQSSRRDVVGALMFDPGRGLWIGTSAGIEIMDPDDGKRREIFHFSGSGTAFVEGFALAADGTMWCATTSGVLRFAPHSESAQIVDAANLPSALSVMIARDRKSVV